MLNYQRGFTLVELMISVVIGLLVITGIMVTLSTGTSSTADNRSRLYATNALRTELEVLRTTAFDTVVAMGSTSNFSNTQVAHLVGGTGTLAIGGSSIGQDIKKITMTVGWTSQDGRALSESLTSYITRKGLNGS